MNWIKDFYKHQFEAGVYSTPVLDYHREKAQFVRERLKQNSTTILELGCGGGQVAVAMSELGLEVTALDLVEEMVAQTKALAEKTNMKIDVVQGDFHSIKLEKKFDAVVYFDGFGVGEDTEQQILLKNIQEWLLPNGLAFIEIYNPLFWKEKAAGRSTTIGNFERQYDFDINKNRMIDAWWPVGHPEKKQAQSLRCYSLSEFEILIKNIGLKIVEVVPEGTIDYENKKYINKASQEECMSYLVVLSEP